MLKQQRPLTFWTAVAVTIFVAMSILWAFSDEPTGAVSVLASLLWWGSGVVLVLLGLIVIGRWRREPERR